MKDDAYYRLLQTDAEWVLTAGRDIFGVLFNPEDATEAQQGILVRLALDDGEEDDL